MPSEDDAAHALRLRHSLHSRWQLAPHTLLHVALLLVVHPTLRISSGRRSQERNRAVGGSERSLHLLGRAVDLTGPLDELKSAAKTARAQRVGPGCGGPEEVLIEDPGGRRQHLHVSW